jgi:protein-tyrosine-phosphatase
MESMLRAQLGSVDFEVASVGLRGGSGEIPVALRQVLEDRDIELSLPIGKVASTKNYLEADLILFADRGLLREAVVQNPSLWQKSYTLKEFARLAYLNPPVPKAETFSEWILEVGVHRTKQELSGAVDFDDVADPGLGGSREDYVAMCDTISDAVEKISHQLLIW